MSMMKAVIDIDREILAVNAELHSDLKQMLLEDGSNQKYLYGINIYYDNGEIENSFCMKAIEFLELMKKDPKNRYRKGELDCCIDELQDYLMGENLYNTTEEQLVKYYDAFL